MTDLARLAQHVTDRLTAAYGWLDDHTPDGYPTVTAGSGTFGTHSEPAASPTANAVTAGRTLDIPVLELEGVQECDLRTVRIMLDRALDQAEHNLRWAQQICDAIPRQAQGEKARTIDHQLRHSRCEGWADRHAICDDLSVQRTTVNGSIMEFCGRCYARMWSNTEATVKGRVTKEIA